MFENDYNPQARKWIITINNPQDHGLDRDYIIDLMKLSTAVYFCMADEISATGTPHTHIYMYSHSPVRFSTLKNRFPTAHLDKANGTSQENRDYIRKEGKWADTVKAETRIEGTFFEFGEMPSTAEEKAPKMHQLLKDVADGLSTTEIILENPGFAFKGKDIDGLRETILFDRYKVENRAVKVIYLYGDTGTGKTRTIFRNHRAADICRITDYGAKTGVRFDAYHGQSVLVFEEFHGQIEISSMLNFLDIYPVMLPARYYDRVACFETVYITSNISLDEQYTEIQKEKPEVWNALLRRIHEVWEFRKNGEIQKIIHLPE